MPNVGITIKLDMPQIFNKVQNDEFGLFLAQEWKRLIEPYTPYRDGHLAENVECKPFEIIYKSLYARYMYEGFVYVDPIYKKGGFTSDGGITFWSRPGIKKEATNRKFDYSKDTHPQATDHWDKVAEQAGQKVKLTESANRYLRRVG